ncbi:MAG TPA: OmpA family protein [Thermoanaerobaculia bacterium]|nr:OmpA family protein [Thermoanaerobaculia bacterium]
MSETLTRATLLTAQQMAATGGYAAASRLLDGCDPTLDVLLLRAKMAAQQVLYQEAIAHWREVLKMSPENGEAQRGMALAQRLDGGKGSRFYLRANIFYALLLAAIVALLIALASLASCGGGHSEAASLRALAAEQKRQIETTRNLVASLTEAANRPGNRDAIDLRLDVPGASSRRDGSELVLTFAEGLFHRGIELRPEARQSLASLARQLEPLAGRVTVCVEGHTDDETIPAGAPYRDNAALALARGAVVVEQLRAAASLPVNMFSVRGLGEIAAPHPNDTAENRARNRTAVIRISKGHNQP